MERTDIEIRFSEGSGAARAREIAKAMVWGYYKNGCEYLPFDDMKKENADGWRHYPGRYAGSEKVSAFTALCSEYRMDYRRSSRGGASGFPHQEEARELISHIRRDEDCFVFEDCDAIGSNHQIGNYYFEDLFSMLCFFLASTSPDDTFEGMERRSGTGYSKRILTHAVYDGKTLRFEQMEGDPVYSTLIVSWTRSSDRFVKRSLEFPFIRVDIKTKDHDALERDEELAEWIRSVNDIPMVTEIDPDEEVAMISAELCFKHPSFNPYPYVMLNAASRDICVELRDELMDILADKGYKTKCFSLLKANELTGEHIVIPESVTKIGDKAFWKKQDLKSVVISGGVREIGEWAFRDCSSLEDAVIPACVKVIDDSAFGFCSPELVIRGEKDSKAESFAEKKGIRFEHTQV